MPMHRAYLDNNATTPIDPRVATVVEDVNRQVVGNPSSIHWFGRAARQVVEAARATVATALGAQPKEIIFVSSATEANNLAVRGLAATASTARRIIVASPIEHPSVLQPLKALEDAGFRLRWLPVARDGSVDAARAAELFDDDVAFCAMMWVNNETGVAQPVSALTRLCRERGIPLHCDGVQAAGRLALDDPDTRPDMISLSGHKIHGPKGVGVLYVRTGVRVAPQLIGGGQERDRRAGTENVGATAGFARALELSGHERPTRHATILALETRLCDGLRRVWPEVVLNADHPGRVCGVMNWRFPGQIAETLMMRLDLLGVAVSVGSACSSGATEPSHVLRAMGYSREEVLSSLRVSLSAFNTVADIDLFIDAMHQLRQRKSE